MIKSILFHTSVYVALGILAFSCNDLLSGNQSVGTVAFICIAAGYLIVVIQVKLVSKLLRS